MDDFVSSFLSSSSWTAVTSLESPSWVDTSALQTNDTFQCLSDSYRIINEQNSTMCVISSGQTIQTVPDHESIMHRNDGRISIFVDEDLKYGLNKDMLALENQLQQDISGNISLPTQQNGHHGQRFSFPGALEDNSVASSFAADCNPVRSFATEQLVFPPTLKDPHSASTISQFWPSSYESAHSLSRGENNVQSLGYQEGVVENAANILGRTFSNGKISQLGSFPGALDVKKESPKSHIASSTPASEINMTRTTGAQPSNYQMPHSSNGNFAPITHAQHSPTSANCANGTAKPRMRARRGQATDPHSIAERLRREKIADRMKNLQELVPNSNKSDKASMLDEIIDYVKFLQLQVKVLSMSRLGAAGAVVPLITDAQPEGSSNLLLSPSVEFWGTDLSDSQDDIAFEQEVVKLMESNVTMAMQFLQNKGLCLMPVALASAISARKGLSSVIPPERKKPDSSPEVLSQRNEAALKERNDAQQLPKSCNRSVTRLEGTQNPPAISRDSKPKA